MTMAWLIAISPEEQLGYVVLLLAAGLIALVAGPFLKRAGFGYPRRMVFYAMGSTAIGLCILIADAGGAIGAWELVSMALGMSFIWAIVIGVTVCVVTIWRLVNNAMDFLVAWFFR